MSYTTTTSYGTWCNQVSPYSTSPDADVLDYINGGDVEWRELLEASGALEDIQREYRNAIDEALPPSVSLCGDEFIGPYEPDGDEWDGYPTDEYGGLDIKACLEDIDLESIIDRNDVVVLDEIGRFYLKSQAQNPAKVASSTMRRLGVKPFSYQPVKEGGRPQAIYRKGDVQQALASRPGRGVGGGPKKAA